MTTGVVGRLLDLFGDETVTLGLRREKRAARPLGTLGTEGASVGAEVARASRRVTTSLKLLMGLSGVVGMVL